MSLREIIENWYEGEFVPFQNEPNDPVFIMGGRYRRHWTAQAARVLVKFWQNHWQWTVGTMLAICGLAVALTRH
jgi:hypothetical protein